MQNRADVYYVMFQCGFYWNWSSDHHERFVGDRLAAFMQMTLLGVFSLEGSAEVYPASRDIVPMRLYEEGARLLDRQRYVQSSVSAGLLCMTAKKPTRVRGANPTARTEFDMVEGVHAGSFFPHLS